MNDNMAGPLAKVQRLARQVSKTFRLPVSNPAFQENLNKSRTLINSIQAQDLNFDFNLVRNTRVFNPRSNEMPPVTYVKIHEDCEISIGIFVLKDGARLPLHDHPGMHGLLKVIHGSLRARAFNEVSPALRQQLELQVQLDNSLANLVKPVFLHSDTEVDVNSDVCVLSPTVAGIHEIAARSGPAAFLDVLAPPYDIDGERDCHYFGEVFLKMDNPLAKDVCWLTEISCPSDFWCDSAPYQGPDITCALDDACGSL
ncbi:PREDICTED: 2-aminoethanethiol dioxygenase-like [Priapulus caudatus]|uniref:2-aminoethanethiol dioxygenase-like n=1 Tax=Priapulus caudatus TaxID=37621 RepID=A0ABM1DVF8_PRICU|nr:PREDICTED: 2-aminoethanethiol dioxygenase-like [Priapulus caudatus]